MDDCLPGLCELLAALRFAAERHRGQRRKGLNASPYINHPIEVATLLARLGRVGDPEVLQAAVLHDTLEDTATSAAELERHFGARVRRLVEEVSDDPSLTWQERKRRQVERASRLSRGAQQIKIADKICNLCDLVHRPPEWDRERKLRYFDWADRVVAGCRGSSPRLERLYDRVSRRGRRAVRGEC